MERSRVQGYVASLEQILRNAQLDLKETTVQFEELCHRVTPDRMVPPAIIVDIRKAYKEIQDHLTRIREVNQLLESRYRRYYHRDSLRDREITQFAFLTKSLYLKFESMLQEIEAKKKLKAREEHVEAPSQRIPFLWFHSKENQVLLLRTLQNLTQLGYKTRSDLEGEDRREVIQHRPRSLSLFILSGEAGFMEILQSRMKLREYDIKERYASDELRGALTHLKDISLPEVQKVLKRFMDSSELSKIKCLLFSVQSQKALEKDILGTPEKILEGMKEGELKILPV